MTFALIDLPLSGFPIVAILALLALGLVGLSFGGDWLTGGAAAVSVNLKINPVIVGLTVVSIGTSMPELLTSLLAAGNSPGLAIGNIVGSNIANIGLILGLTALYAPLAIQIRLVYREVPILIAVTGLFTLFAFGGFVRWEGAVLLFLTVAYLGYIIRSARNEPEAVNTEFLEEVEEAAKTPMGKAIVAVVAGTLVLAVGADLLVSCSVELASRMGISEALIGLTIVAVGTSLPELAASIAAARAGHSDICAGNIVGSNLFNLLLIGGSVASIVPFPVDSNLLLLEFPAMIALTAILLLFFKTGHVVSRREGAVLLMLYFVILLFSALAQVGMLF